MEEKIMITTASNEKIDFSEEALNKFVEAVEKFRLDCVKIFLGNPFDLIEMDMSEIPSDCYFISNQDVEKGKLLLVKDDMMKEELYKFAQMFPDRVFRGLKEDCEIDD
jgi:hypothetical protein